MQIDQTILQSACSGELVRILLADDDPILCEFARKELQLPGLELIITEDGKAAIERLAEGGIDLVLLDLGMPKVDGFEVLQYMRSDPKLSATPVIIITGRDDTAAIDQAFSAGATSFLMKPLNWKLITHQIAYTLRNSRNEAALRQARIDSEAANAAKSRFLANMSHELRTPLNGVLGLAGAMSRTKLDNQQMEMVGLIHDSGLTLQCLLSDILDLSKIESGHFELNHEQFDLVEVVTRIGKIAEIQALEKDLQFEVYFENQARGLFIGDPIRLRQILLNLTSNAVKFTQTGSIKITVDVEDSAEDPLLTQLTISVIDTGIGFGAVKASKLFERFEQADNSITRNFGGTGLGLSICRELTNLMGGSIGAESGLDCGATFTIKVPLQRAIDLHSYDQDKASKDSLETDHVQDSFEITIPRSILLAEDHVVNQRVVSIILSGFGVKLDIVANGREALDAFLVGNYDLILMDMQMPVMDGLTATRAIRDFELAAGTKPIAIAMLSANAMPEHVKAAYDAGCDFHIAKPISPDNLIKGIQDTLATMEAREPGGQAVG
jgi:two-component system, sensor histidine kinase